jgi:hypothetical protein
MLLKAEDLLRDKTAMKPTSLSSRHRDDDQITGLTRAAMARWPPLAVAAYAWSVGSRSRRIRRRRDDEAVGLA